jgi:hypothetical protein
MDESTEFWDAAKKDALKKIKELPNYEDDDIVNIYTELLRDLEDPAMRGMNSKAKAFEMHNRYPEFALAYSGLFNVACRREKPPSPDNVRELLKIARAKNEGQIHEDKARGMVMDVAEGTRRNKT